MKITDRKNSGHSLYIVGGALTVIYLSVLAWYGTNRWTEIVGMSPNNLGDLLSGSFSPLAFAWLVLGFIQQGIELRQNSTALLLQAEELRTAAGHAGAMVELQRKDFELRIRELEEVRQKADTSRLAELKREDEQAIRKIQPEFSFDLAHRDFQNQKIAKTTLTNYGNVCTGMKILMEPISGVLELSSKTEFDVFASELKIPVVFSFGCDIQPCTQPLTIT